MTMTWNQSVVTMKLLTVIKLLKYCWPIYCVLVVMENVIDYGIVIVHVPLGCTHLVCTHTCTGSVWFIVRYPLTFIVPTFVRLRFLVCVPVLTRSTISISFTFTPFGWICSLFTIPVPLRWSPFTLIWFVVRIWFVSHRFHVWSTFTSVCVTRSFVTSTRLRSFGYVYTSPISLHTFTSPRFPHTHTFWFWFSHTHTSGWITVRVTL